MWRRFHLHGQSLGFSTILFVIDLTDYPNRKTYGGSDKPAHAPVLGAAPTLRLLLTAIIPVVRARAPNIVIVAPAFFVSRALCAFLEYDVLSLLY